MKKEVITVPKDKSIFDVLAEMGESTAKAWIFIHNNVWNAMDENQKKRLCVEPRGLNAIWLPVILAGDLDIAFSSWTRDPENIYFLKMEE